MADVVQRVARVIASKIGDDYDHAFAGKGAWVAARGMSGGRYRDVNEPHKDDYDYAANGALITILDIVDANLLAVQYDPAPYTAMKARLAAMREEALPTPPDHP